MAAWTDADVVVLISESEEAAKVLVEMVVYASSVLETLLVVDVEQVSLEVVCELEKD